MKVADYKRAMPSAAVLAWYNAVPNLLWSALAFAPLVVFCYQYLPRLCLYGFGAVSLLPYAWPVTWLQRLQLSSNVAAYRRLRVPALNQFTQNGALINRLVRQRYPNYCYQPTRAALLKLHRTTYQQERFHWAALIFFLLASGYALAQGRVGWAAGLTGLNVGYNLYPIWLQQYLRLRLRRLNR